jgi:hypothetical protein
MQKAPPSSLSLEWILFFLFCTESWVRDQVAKLFNAVEFKIDLLIINLFLAV